MLGEKDSQTPIEISTRYFEEVQAPDKKLYLISDAGHAPMIDNVEAYRKAVREIVGFVGNCTEQNGEREAER